MKFYLILLAILPDGRPFTWTYAADHAALSECEAMGREKVSVLDGISKGRLHHGFSCVALPVATVHDTPFVDFQ